MEMKTDIGFLPARCQKELERAVEILFEEFDKSLRRSKAKFVKNGRIQRIILYGSFARNDYVIDPYSGPHSGYVSDYDLLVTVNDRRLTDFDYWTRANDRFLRFPSRGPTRPQVKLIVHSNRYVNQRLRRGAYFFVDVAKEGILLYEAPHTRKLADPEPLTPQAALEESQNNYEIWFPGARGFLDTSRYVLDKGRLKESAFQLHQAVEHAYRAFLLTLTHYAPRHHDIEKLRSDAERVNRRLVPVWPRYYRRDQRLFQLLKDAYVKARYSPHYVITEKELDWLGAQVAELHKLIERKCKNRFATLKRRIKR